MRPLLVLCLWFATVMSPTAAADGIMAGPLGVEATFHEVPDCTLRASDQVCLVAWDEGAEEGAGDDRIDVALLISKANVTVDQPLGGDSYGISLRPQEAVVVHPANRVAKGTWLALNDSLPDATSSYVRLEANSRNMHAIVDFPTPLVFPTDGEAWHGTGLVVYAWDCSFYFTDYYNWDDFCTYDGVRPLPNGLRNDGSTDGSVALLQFASCAQYEVALPQACPVLAPAESMGRAASEAWRNATPDIRRATRVDEISVNVTGSGNTARGPQPGGQPLSRPPASAPLRLSQPRDASAPGMRDPQPLPVENNARTLSPNPPTSSASTVTPLSSSPSHPQSGNVFAIVVGAVTAMVVVAVLLYHRLTRSQALQNANRERIYRAILDSPGIRAGTIAASLDLHHDTVTGHIRVLERFGLVEGTATGQRRYFARGMKSVADKASASALASSDVAQRIFDHLSQHGETDLAGLRAKLHLPPSTASSAVSRLVRAGLLRKRREGTRVWVQATPRPGSF